MKKVLKIDFINHSDSNIELVDNIFFQTELDVQEIIDILEEGPDDSLIEGTGIEIINLETLILIEYSSFMDQGFSLRDKFSDVEKFIPIGSIHDNLFHNSKPREEYVFIQGIDFHENPALSKRINQLELIKYTSITEWGASGFWEIYVAGVAVNLTSRMIDKLKNIGVPSNCISTYKLSAEMKRFISDEFKVNPDSLVLINFSRIGDNKIKLEFRDIHNKYFILHDEQNIIDFKYVKL